MQSDSGTKGYSERTYRHLSLNKDHISFQVLYKNTDIFIAADHNFKEVAFQSVRRHRQSIEHYIDAHPDFLSSLVPLPYDDLAPAIVRQMFKASSMAGVGPMASVAGAIAEQVGEELARLSEMVIVENGGDLYLKSTRDVRVGIFAANSCFSERLVLQIKKEDMPIGIATSSATIGHSMSFGRADAVCVKAKSAAIADAAATALGNNVREPSNIKKVLEKGMKMKGVLGVIIIMGDHLGVLGEIEFGSPH